MPDNLLNAIIFWAIILTFIWALTQWPERLGAVLSAVLAIVVVIAIMLVALGVQPRIIG